LPFNPKEFLPPTVLQQLTELRVTDPQRAWRVAQARKRRATLAPKRELAAGLQAGSNVRGALVGRNVLYPGAGDPLATAEAAGGLVHRDWSLAQALDALETQAGRDLDWLARLA
jgi:hypothetical protein